MDVELVRKYYFEDKLKIVEIAKILGVNKSTISRVLKQFSEFENEKERRKKESEKRAKEWRNEYKKQKRKKEKEEEEALYAGMMNLQRQNAMSMSKKRTLSTDTLVKLCITHYEYDKQKEKLIFKEDWGKRPEDLPKSVDVHKDVLKQFKEYAQKVESEKWMSETEKKVLSQ
ncbi:helix-turn-helix domain-containing protein [Thermoanaerobacter uzonensis]|uniref:helix-turn-helix domain-containing protein n=1 Tax=Thermoanaerobacter uzonensis TaxID=447593 RepID=UPI003D767A67